MSSDKLLDHESALEDWHKVGVYPTPDAMADRFGMHVADWLGNVSLPIRPSKRISLLDACSGDGRLGHAVAQKLTSLGYIVSVTFLEVDAGTAASISLSAQYPVKVINANLFTHVFAEKFDLVVSNPPYRAINCADAKKFGFNWVQAQAGGRNLYGLSLKRCIDVCKSKGFVAVIAPHGWLRNDTAGLMREFVARSCVDLRINAFSNRTLFPGVNQDTSFQCAVIDKETAAIKKKLALTVQLRFDGGRLEKLPLLVRAVKTSNITDELRVRVGPFVWNREKRFLQNKIDGGLVVINGANIGQDGRLSLTDPRFEGRQFATKEGLPENHITKAPFIVVKRTMRGKPGQWQVDSALVRKRNFACVAENHSVVIEVVAPHAKKYLIKIQAKLADRIEALHRFHGHPNISVRLVRAAVEALLEELG